MSKPTPPKGKRPSAPRADACDVNMPSIERHAIDQVLLAIIDGYAGENDLASATWHLLRIKRLRDARKALFADDDAATDPSDQEIAALKMMALWHRRDTQLQAMRVRDPACLPAVSFKKPRSFRELAREASLKIMAEERSDFIEKIRKKFSQSRDLYVSLMHYGDDIEAIRESNAVQKALNALAALGIRSVR